MDSCADCWPFVSMSIILRDDGVIYDDLLRFADRGGDRRSLLSSPLSSRSHGKLATGPNEPPFQSLAAGGVKQALTFAECLQLQGSAVRSVVDGGRRRRGGGLRGRRGRGGERSRGGGGRGEGGGGQGRGGGRRGERPDEEDVCGARLEVVDADPRGSRLHSRIALILLFLWRQNVKL